MLLRESTLSAWNDYDATREAFNASLLERKKQEEQSRKKTSRLMLGFYILLPLGVVAMLPVALFMAAGHYWAILLFVLSIIAGGTCGLIAISPDHSCIKHGELKVEARHRAFVNATLEDLKTKGYTILGSDPRNNYIATTQGVVTITTNTETGIPELLLNNKIRLT